VNDNINNSEAIIVHPSKQNKVNNDEFIRIIRVVVAITSTLINPRRITPSCSHNIY